MAYGTLEHAFWEAPDLQELGLEGRAVAAYLLTCRHSSSEGYYRLAVGYICDDLCITRDAALAYLRALDLKDFARFDEASQVVFIRNAMRWRPPKGNPSITGALRRASDLPFNPFRGMFYASALQWAPDFATVLRDAGWAVEAGGPAPVPRTPSLFEAAPLLELPPAPPRALAAVPPPADVSEDLIDQIMRQASVLSVQQSIAQRETIRNAEAVAKARLAKNCVMWRTTIERWLTTFDGVTPTDMANALVDGGTSKPHWRRAALA